MINLEMGTDEVVIKVEFINFYRFYIAENDKDKIELEANRLENILKLSSYYYNNYLQAKNDEENNVDSSGGLTYIGRSDYGY